MNASKYLLLLAAVLPVGCSDPSVSTADVQQAAKERVRNALDLTKDSTLFTNVFVGEPVNGDTILCGTVEGKDANGAAVTPRRFIVATEPADWIKFEPVTGMELPSQPDKFAEWHTACLGEQAA